MWFAYFWYLIKHKYFVCVACFTFGLYWRGLFHDMSKFRPSEFFPYADYFFGKERRGGGYEPKPPYSASLSYDIAWTLHKHRNEHHWQYWVSINDNGEVSAIPIPKKIVEEMVCDWYGAGKAQKNPVSPRTWFNSKKKTLTLHKETIEHIGNALYNLELYLG